MCRHAQQTAYKCRQMYHVQYRLVERQADAGHRWEDKQKQTGRHKKVQRQEDRQAPVDRHVCKSVAGIQACSQAQAGRHRWIGMYARVLQEFRHAARLR
jgi:hypothetical protein